MIVTRGFLEYEISYKRSTKTDDKEEICQKPADVKIYVR